MTQRLESSIYLLRKWLRGKVIRLVNFNMINVLRQEGHPSEGNTKLAPVETEQPKEDSEEESGPLSVWKKEARSKRGNAVVDEGS